MRHDNDTLPAFLGPGGEQLRRLATLEDDWDSYGGSPPTDEAIDAACSLLSLAYAFHDERMRPYDVAPVPDGGVQVEWRGHAQHLEIEIGPRGQIGYLVKNLVDGGGREYEEGDEITVTRALQLVAEVLNS